jgi:hypothetical protein
MLDKGKRSTGSRLGGRLTSLKLDLLTLIANSFTLVGLGLSQRSNFRSELSDLLLVATSDDDMSLVWTRDF